MFSRTPEAPGWQRPNPSAPAQYGSLYFRAFPTPTDSAFPCAKGAVASVAANRVQRGTIPPHQLHLPPPSHRCGTENPLVHLTEAELPTYTPWEDAGRRSFSFS